MHGPFRVIYIEIGSVGSERSRWLAGGLAHFVTDKTLLLSDSGITNANTWVRPRMISKRGADEWKT